MEHTRLLQISQILLLGMMNHETVVCLSVHCSYLRADNSYALSVRLMHFSHATHAFIHSAQPGSAAQTPETLLNTRLGRCRCLSDQRRPV